MATLHPGSGAGRCDARLLRRLQNADQRIRGAAMTALAAHLATRMRWSSVLAGDLDAVAAAAALFPLFAEAHAVMARPAPRRAGR